jgi:serine/threonine protein kinase
MGANLVGKLLGDFEIEAVVGKGSMARVYQARQVSLRRQVALKVLEEGIFTPGDNVKRFLREAEALARLEHANIVPIYAAGEEPPYYYFAMRLIRGGTLHDAMREGITRAMGLRWSYQICRALAYAHTSGIVHRDLKPTNVLIHDGVALLSDFGLARLRDVSTITQMGYIVGTPLYMAPEQTQGGEVGPATDCFALGVMMYQLVTGRHPFVQDEPRSMSRAERRTRLFRRIQAAQCNPPTFHDPKITPEIAALIMRALAEKPQDRHADGPAMLKAMDEAWRRTQEDERVIQYERSVENEGDDPDPGPENLTREPAPEPMHMGSTVAFAGENSDQAQPADSARSESAESKVANTPQLPDKSLFLSMLGRYKIIKELGHGGQGVVYHAHDPVLDREVALKVLRNEALSDRRMHELFWNEARVAARLNHPHIITIYDFGIEADSPFLTMQLIDGPSLDHMIAKGRPLPLRFA